MPYIELLKIAIYQLERYPDEVEEIANVLALVTGASVEEADKYGISHKNGIIEQP